ncbi:hypothetical protein A1C72_RS02970 [Acinetobacter baumannii]|nr:hypothetical protein [Acinetobacter baumannii]
MNLISGKDFVDQYGIDAAKEVINDRFFRRDYYYCHVFKSGFLNMSATFSDYPNIRQAEWIKLSDLEDYLKSI